MKRTALIIVLLFNTVFLKAQVTKTVNVSAGSLANALTTVEHSTITNLTITGNIDARDFKTMRDDMPLLTDVDLKGVNILAYNGTLGTEGTGNLSYLANAIPQFAFNSSATDQAITKLSSIVLPQSVTSIGQFAFHWCNGLTSINIPPLVTTIKWKAFFSCQGMKNIQIPSSVISIDDYAFSRGKGSFIVDASNPNFSSVDGVLFNKDQTTLICCQGSKTGDYIVPLTVKSLGNDAFGDCTLLTAIVLPEGLINIGSWSLSTCALVSNFTIPATVTFIDSYAFPQNYNLQRITSLTPSPVDLTGKSGVFTDINKSTCILDVPFGSASLYKAANQWQDFTNIEELPGLKISETIVNLKAEQGSMSSIEISSNVNWSAISDQSWLTLNPSSGTGNKILSFHADANNGKIIRIAHVTISAEG